MAAKRSRSAYEADSQAKQSPFVLFGTPLPPFDSDARDDGSYLPLWKQEVVDERGRKRLHGAFTGGFSAGYFNTVGSKEGWAPTTFKSSRTNRQKQDDSRKAEDFMDEEDMADAEQAQVLQTNQSYAALGSTQNDDKRHANFIDLLKPDTNTMGTTLLQKMGWRQGQGLGPKVKRPVRLQDNSDQPLKSQDEHLFAPQNSPMIQFIRKDDRKGLGFAGESRLNEVEELSRHGKDSDQDENPFQRSEKSTKDSTLPKPRTGFGIGVLNDDSDDGDAYNMGPRISYSKVIGGDKKTKRKSAATVANPLLKTKPVYRPKKSLQVNAGFRKCHDGRLPIQGFLLSETIDHSFNVLIPENPKIPPGWQSAKNPSTDVTNISEYRTNSEIAKSSILDPKSRAQILGETQLPGKSIFDFLSPAARDRLVSASGKSNLPNAGGESIPSAEKAKLTNSAPNQMPTIDKNVALSALGRGIGGWMPYAEDQEKRSRYRSFLEWQGGIRAEASNRPQDISSHDWIRECREFAHAAEVFKPMTGFMASRFTTSTQMPASTSGEEETLISKPSFKAEDPAEAAAKLGMFGPMTRSVHQFNPDRLVCKRFGLKPPAHADAAAEETSATSTQKEPPRASDLVSKATLDGMKSQVSSREPATDAQAHDLQADAGVVDAEHNDALEGQKAGDAVFKAIFGSDDEDDD